eukprot:Skav208720  [mRNA]  locus=scaffold615:32106:37774:+ [translate_table: standard]
MSLPEINRGREKADKAGEMQIFVALPAPPLLKHSESGEKQNLVIPDAKTAPRCDKAERFNDLKADWIREERRKRMATRCSRSVADSRGPILPPVPGRCAPFSAMEKRLEQKLQDAQKQMRNALEETHGDPSVDQ